MGDIMGSTTRRQVLTTKTFRWGQGLGIGTCLTILLLLGGCASPNRVARDAPQVRLIDLQGERSKEAVEQFGQFPVVVSVRKGDRVPIDLQIDSSLAKIEGDPLYLVAEKDFYILFQSKTAPLLSEDGVSFDEKPKMKNYFSVGFQVQKGEETLIRAHFGIRPDGKLDKPLSTSKPPGKQEDSAVTESTSEPPQPSAASADDSPAPPAEKQPDPT